MSNLLLRLRAELTSRVVSTISSVILIVLLARLLSPDDYGLLFLAISILEISKLLFKGVAKSGARYVSVSKSKSGGYVNTILTSSLTYTIGLLAIASIILIRMKGYISQIIGSPGLSVLLYYGVAYIIFGTFTTFARILLQGFESIEAAAVVHALDRGLRVIFSVGFVLLGFGVLGALWGYIFGFTIASTIGMGILYTKHYEMKPAIISKKLRKDIFRRVGFYSVPLTASSSANVLDNKIDTVLVGFFLSPLSVSYYTIGKQIVTFIETPVSALGFTISPSFASEKAKGDADRAAQIYEVGLKNTLLLYVPAAAGLILLANPIVEHIFGSGYEGAPPVLKIFGLYSIFLAVTKVTANGLDFLGRARTKSIIKIITTIGNVFLNILLIPRMGVSGAALATVFTYGIYTAANVYLMYNELSYDFTGISRDLLKILAITSVMSVVVYSLSSYITGILSLIFTVLSGMAVWCLLAVIFGLLEKELVFNLIRG